ncbi:MAG: vitamin K epoxide reductase/DsbA family protein [Pseudobdellovibrio sp.]
MQTDNKLGSILKNQNIILILISALMIFISLYLTQHYFEIKFPKGLSGGSICNINEFFNCDKTTNSPLAAPFNAPTSVMGGIIGLFILAGVFLKKESYDRTLYFVLILNFVGCLALFGYSLLNLNSICLFCSFYYVLSGGALYIYFKKNIGFFPHAGLLVAFAVVSLVVLGSVRQMVVGQLAEIEKSDALLNESVIAEFNLLKKIDVQLPASEYKLNTVTNAPLQMTIFSDFECPACRAFSEQIPSILENYKDKIDINYFFYPLDQDCNPNINHPMHQHACHAAEAVICSPVANFFELHDTFFRNQNQFPVGFVEQLISQNHLEECVNASATKEKLQKIIDIAKPIDLHSTPTFVLNGAKFEGAVPYYKLKIILDYLLDKSSK